MKNRQNKYVQLFLFKLLSIKKTVFDAKEIVVICNKLLCIYIVFMK